MAALRKISHLADNAAAPDDQREGLRKLRAKASSLIELIRDPQELAFRREATASLAHRIASSSSGPSHAHTTVLRAGGARASTDSRSSSPGPDSSSSSHIQHSLVSPPVPSPKRREAGAAADVAWGEYVPPPPPLDPAHEAAIGVAVAELDKSLGVQPPSPTSPPLSPASPPPPPIFSIDPFAGLLVDLETEGHIETGGAFDSSAGGGGGGGAGGAASDAPPLCDIRAAAWSLSSPPNPALLSLPALKGVGPAAAAAPRHQLDNVEALLAQTAAQREGGVQSDPWAACGVAPASPGTPVVLAQQWGGGWEAPPPAPKGKDSLIDL